MQITNLLWGICGVGATRLLPTLQKGQQGRGYPPPDSITNWDHLTAGIVAPGANINREGGMSHCVCL